MIAIITLVVFIFAMIILCSDGDNTDYFDYDY